MTPPMMSVKCAWCGADMGVKPCSPEMVGMISHGMCPNCADAMKAQPTTPRCGVCLDECHDKNSGPCLTIRQDRSGNFEGRCQCAECCCRDCMVKPEPLERKIRRFLWQILTNLGTERYSPTLMALIEARMQNISAFAYEAGRKESSKP